MPSSVARRRLARARRGGARGGARAVAQRGAAAARAVQDEHAHVGAGVARGDRLAVRPDAEHRVGGARIELGDDRDLHRTAPRPARPRRASRTGGRRGTRAPRRRRRRARSRRRPGVVWRIGVASTTPTGQPCSRGDARPSARRGPSPCAAAGNGSSVSKRRRRERGHRADLDERASRARRRRGRRRVTGHAACECSRWAGWASSEAGVLGAVQEAVEEAARQHDVVVDDEQPVEAGRRVLGEQRVEVLELAAARPSRPCASRRRGGCGEARSARRRMRRPGRSMPSTRTRRRGGARARPRGPGAARGRRLDVEQRVRGAQRRPRAARARCRSRPERKSGSPRRPRSPRGRGVRRRARPARSAARSRPSACAVSTIPFAQR